jgi:hypothetical protein
MPLIVNDKVVDIGAVFRSTEMARSLGICEKGVTVTVVEISKSIPSGTYSVGVCSDIPVSGWHNLSGKTPSQQGYWIQPQELSTGFERTNSTLRVAENVVFNGVNISGKKCRLLKEVRPLGCKFVELEEYVNGGSADGLGKPGHCIPLQSNLVTLE